MSRLPRSVRFGIAVYAIAHLAVVLAFATAAWRFVVAGGPSPFKAALTVIGLLIVGLISWFWFDWRRSSLIRDHPSPTLRSEAAGDESSKPRGIRLLIALAVAPLGSLVEQSGAEAQSVVRGTVKDESGAAVAEAAITTTGSDNSARTDARGQFELRGLAAGVHQIAVRAIGYQPASASVRVSGSDTVSVELVLGRAPVQLDSIVTRGTVDRNSGKLASYYRRESKGFGRFFDQAALAKSEHSALADFLARLGGIRLIRRPQKCGGGFALASGRGPMVSAQSWMACFGGSPRDPETAFPPVCYLTVYLDGVRYWSWGTNEPPDVNGFSIVGLQAIELYRGPAELPAELQSTGSSCGAIVLWTK